MKLISPTGTLIVGVLQRISGVAGVHEFTRNGAGHVDVESWTGQTDVDWNDQKNETTPGVLTLTPQLMLIDEDGANWSAELCREVVEV